MNWRVEIKIINIQVEIFAVGILVDDDDELIK